MRHFEWEEYDPDDRNCTPDSTYSFRKPSLSSLFLEELNSHLSSHASVSRAKIRAGVYFPHQSGGPLINKSFDFDILNIWQGHLENIARLGYNRREETVEENGV